MTRQIHQRCNRRLRDEWQPTTATCAVCGLFGNCRDVEFGMAEVAVPETSSTSFTLGEAVCEPAVFRIRQDPNPAFNFAGPDGWVVRLRFDPPSVELNPICTWDDAAKAFWNGVAAVRGMAPLFPAEQERAP